MRVKGGISLGDVKAALKPLGVTITRRAEGEYRVNVVGGTEDTAYYTDYLPDALGTGRAMSSNTEEWARQMGYKSEGGN